MGLGSTEPLSAVPAEQWIDGGVGMGVGQGNVSRGSVARQSGRLPWQVPGTPA